MTTRISNLLRFMALALVLCLLAALPLCGVAEVEQIADASTMDTWKNLFINTGHTGYSGSLWTDKSVFTDDTAGDAFKDMALAGGGDAGIGVDEDNFLVALSAVASSMEIMGYSTTPTDTMLVLDVSGSMAPSSTVGYRAQQGGGQGGNQRVAVEGVNTDRVDAMVSAANAAIHRLLTLNKHNRVGLVVYSGGAAGNAVVLLPLGRYTGVGTNNAQYLSADKTNHSEQLYPRQNSQQMQTINYTSAVHVSVANGVTTEAGAAVEDRSREVVDATYIQGGLFTAWQQFEGRIAANDTTIPNDKIQSNTKRMPIMVLMSDGAPTKATTNYYEVGDSNAGDGRESDATAPVGFLTQLTASWIRDKMGDGYKTEPRFYTLGLGSATTTDTAIGVLNPSDDGNNADRYWDDFLDVNDGSVWLELPDHSNGNQTNGTFHHTINRVGGVDFVKDYVDRYWAADDADDMVNAFTQIVAEIELQSKYYATLIASGERDIDGYVTIEDEIGEFMEVKNVLGLTIGNTLYSGLEMAQAVTEESLGTTQNPTAFGDELIWTVQERLGIESVSDARNLVGRAYRTYQLYPGDNNGNPPSNYIGWYGDASNNYLGHWEKNHTAADYPTDAVYINRSYGYLGKEEELDSDMMHVIVMVHTNIETGHQSVQYKIPASLIPMVVYSATVDADSVYDADNITFTSNADKISPMRLLLEVGLEEGINEVTVAEVVNKTNPNYEHKDGDGYSFYTNLWDDGENYDDPTDHKATVAFFTPSTQSEYYYFNENEAVLNENGNAVSYAYTQAHPNEQYYYRRWAFFLKDRDDPNNTAAELQNVLLALDELDVANFENVGGYAVIPAGSYNAPAQEMVLRKDENLTHTLDYSFFSRGITGSSAEDFIVYDYLGNNGTFKLTPATGLKLTKTVTETVPNATDRFTFFIKLDDNIDEDVVSVTDENGNVLTRDDWSVSEADRTITVTLTAGQTVCIIGLPAGATYTVTEQFNGDYSATITPSNGTLRNQELIAVNAVNTPQDYGSLVIEKEVDHPFGAIDLDVSFGFTVEISNLTKEQADNVTPVDAAKTYVADDGGKLTITGIMVAGGSSVTLGRIPAGASYTVTETTQPAGFRQTSPVDGDGNPSPATGTIPANGFAEAEFVNTYTPNPATVEKTITVNGTKTLTAIDASIENQSFTFKLQKLDPADNTFKDVSDASAAITNLSAEPNRNGTGEFEIILTESFGVADIGTHYYRVIEVKGNTPGMYYDPAVARFSVTISDPAPIDGVLVATVSALEGPVTVHDTTVSVAFQNTYDVNSTEANITIRKTVNSNVQNHGILPSGFGFQILKLENGKMVNATQGQGTIYPNVNGEFSFPIPITEEGQRTYFLKEVVPADSKDQIGGMDYDEHLRKIVIDTKNVTDASGKASLSSVVTVQVDDDGDGVFEQGETVIGGNSNSVTVPFENKYFLEDGVELWIEAAKTLMNVTSATDTPMVFGVGEYSVQYAPTNSTFEKSTNTVWTQVPFGADGKARISLREDCKEIGTFYYIVREVQGSKPGVTYDQHEWHVTVTTVADANGNLNASYSVVKVGGSGTERNIVFENTYRATGSATVPVGGTKTLNGRQMNVGEFSFELYKDNKDNKDRVLLETVSNHADGSFAFTPLEFTSDDIGETYTYTVNEKIPVDMQGVTYDKIVHTFTVEVYDSNGTVAAQVDVVNSSVDDTANFEFNNSYNAGSVSVTFGGRKELTGRALVDNEFTFELYDVDKELVVARAKNVDGKFELAHTFNYPDDVGMHHYVIRESIPEDAWKLPGVSYDGSTYEVTISVSHLNGIMTAHTEINRPGVGLVKPEDVVFHNAYDTSAAVVHLEAEKKLGGRDLKDGEFRFGVFDSAGTRVATGSNDANGKILFTPITLATAGKYEFTVKEDQGSDADIVYDDRSFTVTVEVVKDSGASTATVTYPEGGIVFENAYPLGLPKTGDDSSVGAWLALMLVSLGGFAAMTAAGRRRREN